MLICVQLGVFAWYAWGSGGVAAAAGPVPVDSPLVYRSDRRRELWRFLTYSVVHAGWLHLAFNLLVQLAVSITFSLLAITAKDQTTLCRTLCGEIFQLIYYDLTFT